MDIDQQLHSLVGRDIQLAVKISGLHNRVDEKGCWRSIFHTRVERYCSMYNVRDPMGCISEKELRMEFVPQLFYLSQKCASPGVQNSTMQSSNSRCTFFNSIIRMKFFGSELEAPLFRFFLVLNSKRTF